MSPRSPKGSKELEALDEMIEEITIDADGVDEQMWAFRQAFEDDVELPTDGFVIGEPVSVIQVNYDGNKRRGLTARCRREDGSEHVVSVSDVALPQGSAGARHIAAYRRRLNLNPYPAETLKISRHSRQHEAAEDEIDLSKPVELVAISAKERAVRCRLLGIDWSITLRARRLWEVVPGAIVTVKPRKKWRYAGYPYLSGEIQSTRIDVQPLDLVPLDLDKIGMWDPKDQYWGEEDELLIQLWFAECMDWGAKQRNPVNFDRVSLFSDSYQT